MRDLLIITPTRHRLESALRLAKACDRTCKADTQLVLAVDDDDDSYDCEVPGAEIVQGPRKTCGQWTNQIALERAGDYRAIASLGDDHVPLSDGWDADLLGGIDTMHGTGITFGNDTAQQEKLPTAPVISSDIIAALGWMFHPGMIHYYCDNVWRELGVRAGCLMYLPGVIVQHLHYCWGTALKDDVYAEAEPAWNADTAAFRAWLMNDLDADAAKVLALRAGKRNPCPSP